MKYILSLLFVCFLLSNCAKNEDHQMVLSGSVKGLKKGTLLLQKIEDSLLVSVDSVDISGDSNYTLTTEVKSPEVYYLYLRLINGSLQDDRIAFFAQSGEITINTTLDKFGQATISGSINEDKFKEYDQLIQRYIDRNLGLIETRLRAQQEGNDSVVQAITKQQQNLVASKYLATVNYAMNHTDLEIAPYLMLSEVYDANLKYLDTVYNALTPKIKDSKYGKALESFIADRKNLGE